MSMKTLRNLLWSLLCLTFVVACSEDPTTEPNKPTPGGPNITKDSVIKLKKNTINASLAGGNYTVEYSIQSDNEHKGAKISASANVAWITKIDVSTENIIKVTVAPNTGVESREGMVTIEYVWADPVALTVKQGAKVNKGFQLENIRPGYFEYTVDVIPEDTETPYIVMSAHPEYIVASEFKTGQDFYEDDLAYFDWLGQFYGLDAVGVMQARAKRGVERDIIVDEGASGIPYTFYCYYVDLESGALLSDVQMFTIKTLAPELKDIEFNINYEIIDGVMARTDVTVDGYEGDYYYDILPKQLVDSYLNDLVTIDGEKILKTNEEVIAYWWSNAVAENMKELSTEEIIAMFTCVGENSDGSLRSQFDYELLANVDYYLFAFTMEEHALCSSVPKIVSFRTGNVKPSDNVITPRIDKLTARTAKFTFDAENDDYYVAGWEKASVWATYGNNDAQIQDYLLHNVGFELLKGDVTTSVRDLEPATDYVLYAFGSRGGVATTQQIFKLPFRTKDGGAGSVSISFKDLGYYDCSDFAVVEGYEYLSGDTHSGEVVFPYEVVFSSEEHGDYFFDIYDWTGRSESEYYTDKQYIDGLLWSIDTYGSNTATHTYTFLKIGSKYELVAIVTDIDGMFSNLYRQWVEPTYDGCRDAAQFVAWWDAYQETQKVEDDNEGDNEGDNEDDNEGDVELQSLVVDYSETKLFSNKVATAAKVSTTTIETKAVVPAHDEMVIRK